MLLRVHTSSGVGSSQTVTGKSRVWAAILPMLVGLAVAGVFMSPTKAFAKGDSSSGEEAGIAKSGSRDAPISSSDSEGEAEAVDSDSTYTSIKDRFWLSYYGIYYGSSVTSPSRFQSGPYTDKDKDRPIFVKNFLTLGYELSDRFALAATGFFTYNPGEQKQLNMQDPSARIACNSILNIGGFNWYGDARIHFPVTDGSRINDMLLGLQTFHYLSYHAEDSRFTFGAYGSARYNHFGSLGFGNDVELYLAPAVNYDLSPKLALTFLYEMGANHFYGDDPNVLQNDGTDFEPGLLWRVTPSLELNPFLNIYTGGRVSLSNTSLGMTLSWSLL